MPQAEVSKSMEKYTSHFFDLHGCLQHLDITVMGKEKFLARINDLKTATRTRKQQKIDLKSQYDIAHLRPIACKWTVFNTQSSVLISKPLTQIILFHLLQQQRQGKVTTL